MLAWNPPPDLDYVVFCISPILFVESLVPIVLPLNYSQYSLTNYDMNFRVFPKIELSEGVNNWFHFSVSAQVLANVGL